MSFAALAALAVRDVLSVRLGPLLNDDEAHALIRADPTDAMALAWFDHDDGIRLEVHDHSLDREVCVTFENQVVLVELVMMTLFARWNAMSPLLRQTDLHR